MRVLGIDPGTNKSGWAIVDMDNKEVVASGHAEIPYLRMVINGMLGPISMVVIEDVVRYKVSNSIDLLATAKMIGALSEVVKQSRQILSLVLMTRPEVILKLTGKRPSSKHKVSKADLQVVVQQKLGLKKPIRPQHANDAAALVVAAVDPVDPTPNVKLIRQRRRAKAA